VDSSIQRTRWIVEGGEQKVERGERLPDPREYAKGSGGAGRRTLLVGGFGKKSTRRGTGNVLPASPFRPNPVHKQCSSSHTP